MATAEQALNASVELSAVAATLRVPCGVLAEFGPGDTFEVEVEESGSSVVLLMNGRPFALATAERVGGRLVATITEIVSNVDQEGCDPWQIRKRPAAKA